MNKPKSERFQQLFQDIADAPSGPINEDLTSVTVKDQFSDLFIRTLAGHLLALGYVRQETPDDSDAAPQHPIKTGTLCDKCYWDKECCKHCRCCDCPSYLHEDQTFYKGGNAINCRCLTIEYGDPCPYYKEVNT